MNIFITGATGFLGKTIVKKLMEQHHSVTCLLLPGDDPSSVPEAEITRGDITQPDTLIDKTSDHDAIVHLAGAVGDGQSWDKCTRLNKEGTLNIAEEAVRSGVRRFIHMSSVSVYGRISGVPIAEDFPLKKINDPYGDTKIDAESILNKLVEKGALDLTTIRPTMIYGPGDLRFLPRVIETLKSGKARLIGKGSNSVDCIHVSDVADFICRVIESKTAVGRIYNLTHPDNLSWKEMITEIAIALKVPVPKKHLPYGIAYFLASCMEAASFVTRKPPRLTRYAVRNVGKPYYYLTDRSKDELAYMPSISLKQGIHEYVNNFEKG